ncbi:hypothetical protein [Embleya sp. NBC_00896]|uniref:hypothetical protein n=1 Tax=Embleya sp. NBC_00896 TaxID=2975961 RepID=UPI003865DB1A|nr:hypothetical protein OG928_20565 [Embleya sp. NBC_00896]
MSRNPSVNYNRRQLVDGVLWEAKPIRVLLLAALLPVGLALFDLGDLGLPRAVAIALGVGLALLVLCSYAVYQYRKLSIGPNGLVLHGLVHTSGLRWEEIASVEAKLKEGTGEGPAYAVVRCTLRGGERKRHAIHFLGAEMLPYLAVDLRYYAAPRGIPVHVSGSADAIRAVDAVEAGSLR